MKMLCLFVVLFFCPYFASCETPDVSGNAFLRVCSSVEHDIQTQIEMGYVVSCAAYITGFIDGVKFGTSYAADKTGKKIPSLLCFPDEVETGQIMKILLKYIRDNPAEAHQRTDILLVNALRQAFPCK
jgi:hypothetical protein